MTPKIVKFSMDIGEPPKDTSKEDAGIFSFNFFIDLIFLRYRTLISQLLTKFGKFYTFNLLSIVVKFYLCSLKNY